MYKVTNFRQKMSQSVMKTNELRCLVWGQLQVDERAVRRMSSMPDLMEACECVHFVHRFWSNQWSNLKPHKLVAWVEQTKSSPPLTRCILLYEWVMVLFRIKTSMLGSETEGWQHNTKKVFLLKKKTSCSWMAFNLWLKPVTVSLKLYSISYYPSYLPFISITVHILCSSQPEHLDHPVSLASSKDSCTEVSSRTRCWVIFRVVLCVWYERLEPNGGSHQTLGCGLVWDLLSHRWNTPICPCADEEPSISTITFL